jgi:hypothetical protein
MHTPGGRSPGPRVVVDRSHTQVSLNPGSACAGKSERRARDGRLSSTGGVVALVSSGEVGEADPFVGVPSVGGVVAGWLVADDPVGSVGSDGALVAPDSVGAGVFVAGVLESASGSSDESVQPLSVKTNVQARARTSPAVTGGVERRMAETLSAWLRVRRGDVQVPTRRRPGP